MRLVARLLGTVPLLLGISLVLFVVIHLAPGGPLDVYADNPSVTPAALNPASNTADFTWAEATGRR